jgi:phenylalanyl-tRNA synthetase alpha chain
MRKKFGNAMQFTIGILKKKAAININKENKELIISITEAGKNLFENQTLDEKFLQNNFPIIESELKPEEKYALKNLKTRKSFLKQETKNIPIIKTTKLYKKIINKELFKQEFIEKLTPEILNSKKWQKQKFRPYDIHADVPLLNAGKTHFVNESINHLKKIWLELGFEEMKGTKTQSAFWDMDTLFVPQDHPAREMQDTFYLDLEPAKIPEQLFKKVKKMHEQGDKDSKGWNYKFSKKISSKVMLRTHTTVLSARHIAQLKKQDLPKKFFKIGKVYRNEALDWKHLFEFYQVEGIVVDKNANFRHLLGYLKEFYQKLGYEKIRLRPAYFPYTEPSVEVEYLNKKKNQWVELGGAGMLRPEVTKMLFGEEIPVLAWGQGMERGITQYFNIHDLRELYNNDFKQLKTIKKFIQL